MLSKRAPELSRKEIETVINRIDTSRQYIIRVTNNPGKFSRYLSVRDGLKLIIPEKCEVLKKGERGRSISDFDVNKKYVVVITSETEKDMLTIYIPPDGVFKVSPEVDYIRRNFNIKSRRV